MRRRRYLSEAEITWYTSRGSTCGPARRDGAMSVRTVETPYGYVVATTWRATDQRPPLTHLGFRCHDRLCVATLDRDYSDQGLANIAGRFAANAAMTADTEARR